MSDKHYLQVRRRKDLMPLKPSLVFCRTSCACVHCTSNPWRSATTTDDRTSGQTWSTLAEGPSRSGDALRDYLLGRRRRKIAERSMLIKNMIEEPIPIMNVSEDVVEWCSQHKDGPAPTQDDDADSRKKTTDIEEWDQKFMQVDQEMLFEIILAANYMDINFLVGIGCKTVANMIKGKPPDLISQTNTQSRKVGQTHLAPSDGLSTKPSSKSASNRRKYDQKQASGGDPQDVQHPERLHLEEHQIRRENKFAEDRSATFMEG